MKGVSSVGMDFSLNIGILAASARDVAGQALLKLGADHPELVIVNADLATSTRTLAFAEQYPDRSFNVGIAEQNMVSVASGMAREGLHPIVLTMAPFLSMRACEQVRTDVCYGKVPVIMLGTYAGYSGGISGATHSGLEDCAIMCSFGGMTVLEPGDPWLIAKMLEAAYELNSPVYMRLGVEAQEPIYDFEKVEYKIGKALVPREGTDATIIASGVIVHHAMQAAEELAAEGIDVRVVDMHTIKPIDEEAVLEAAKTGAIVCAQDHTKIGGLGAQVARVLAENACGCKFKILGTPDEYVPLATTEFLYHRNELDAEGLAKNVRKLLA